MKKVSPRLAVLAVAAWLALSPFEDAHAHGHRTHVSVGFGFGYPAYAWPIGYYGGYYYPRSFVGVTVRPPYRRVRRHRQSEPEVRNKTLYVYPAEGQTETQLADDRYECHVWSVDSTGFDPTLGAGTRDEADDYGRAFTACMEGRGYVVR